MPTLDVEVRFDPHGKGYDVDDQVKRIGGKTAPFRYLVTAPRKKKMI